MNYLEAVITLFAIIDPIGNIPIFMQATEHFSPELRQNTFNVAVSVAFMILVLFALTGNIILKYVFHIEMADLQIAGGILLVLIAVKDLVFSSPRSFLVFRHASSAAEIGCVPLACPLLAGPGAMVTILTIWKNPQAGPLAAILAITIVLVSLRIILRYIDHVSKIMGKLITTAVAKIMLVFIAAIGVHMVILGVSYYFCHD